MGNLVHQKDAKPDVFPNELWFTYDALNRMMLKNYESASQTDIAFTYDDVGTNGKGRLRQVTDQAGTVKYEYDPRGNVSKFTRDLISVGKRFEYEYVYDNLGRLTDVGYPKETSRATWGQFFTLYSRPNSHSRGVSSVRLRIEQVQLVSAKRRIGVGRA